MSFLCYRSKIISNINTHHLWVAYTYIYIFNETACLYIRNPNIWKIILNPKNILIWQNFHLTIKNILFLNVNFTFLPQSFKEVPFWVIFLRELHFCWYSCNTVSVIWISCLGSVLEEPDMRAGSFNGTVETETLDVCTETMLLKASLY